MKLVGEKTKHDIEGIAALQEANLIHVWKIQPVQVAPSDADPGNQSDQDGRISGPLGVSLHRGCRLQVNRGLAHFEVRFLQLNRRPTLIFAAKS